MTVDVAVIILTYNEEANLPYALASVVGWARQVFVFDSGSTDRTVEIAKRYGAEVMVHPFENYGKQRNAALERLPIATEWVLFLDADEWLTEELKDEIAAVLARRPEENGFYLKWRLLWMGRWIRRGYYPTWILRLFRYGKGRCEERGVNEHLIVDGPVGRLEHDFIHEDRKGLAEWIAKHVRYAQREAEELKRARRQPDAVRIPARFWGTQAERKRWLRERVWNRLPPLVRPWFYFGYRLVVRGGFLDGWRAVAYHALQGLWFPLLIDLFYLERRNRRVATAGPAPAADEPAVPV